MDPRGVPEHRLLRHARGADLDRRRGRGADLFLQDGEELSLERRRCSPGCRRRPRSTTRSSTPTRRSGAPQRRARGDARPGLRRPGGVRQASTSGLRLDRGYKYTRIREPYFFDFVEQELIDRYGVNPVRQGGLEVETSIDPVSRTPPSRRSSTGLPRLDRPAVGGPSTSTPGRSSPSPRARGYETSSTTSPPRPTVSRAPFKAFVLTAAVCADIDPYSTYYTSCRSSLDLPECGHWEVYTAAGRYSGSMNIAAATHASDNTVYAQLDLDVGPENVTETAELMGIQSRSTASRPRGSAVCGSASRRWRWCGLRDAGDGGVHRQPTAIRRSSSPTARSSARPGRGGASSPRGRLQGHPDPRDHDLGGTGTAANTAARRPARPGRPTTSPTPGSSATRRNSRPRSGSATPSTRLVARLQDASAAPSRRRSGRATCVAKGDYCEDFPEPTEPIDYPPFFGNYAAAAVTTPS